MREGSVLLGSGISEVTEGGVSGIGVRWLYNLPVQAGHHVSEFVEGGGEMSVIITMFGVWMIEEGL